MNIQPLIRWFRREKRPLPWRENPSPYSVWVSEIMLQQTRASVVIPYFERWMERFPTIETLAKAKVDEVIKLWEGLGYYSRARNLHAGAKYVVEHFKGQIPAEREELLKLKGVGRYTAGAIQSFAFHKKAAAVDGNVIRVIARLFAIEEDVLQSETKAKIEQLCSDLLPEKEPWVVMEALIELGALVCQKKPDCQHCPLSEQCRAKRQGIETTLPIKSKKETTEKLVRHVAIVLSSEKVLLRRGKKGEIMQDLFEFPYFAEEIEEQLPLVMEFVCDYPTIKHSFTRYQVTLHPKFFRTKSLKAISGYQWVAVAKLHTIPFSSGHRRIADHLLQQV